jgi:hypothetical protein
MGEYLKLHIFTHYGKTYTFLDVKVLVNNETILVFEYSAQSDGYTKTAHFLKSAICGYTTLQK